MSSVARSVSEIPQRIGSLLIESTIVTTNVRLPTGAVSAVMTSAAFAAATSNGVALAGGVVARDMGKEVHIVDGTGMASAIYRLVQPVFGASTEGVGPASVYLKTWDASSSGVQVSRTG